jgi:xylulose-5-phosphate/fructose-6-phosphate phosphoketolase
LWEQDYERLFTADRPVIFNFHGYPWLIHRLAYRRSNHENMHVRSYKEKGSIDTPLELAIRNQTDRFSLAIDVIERIPLEQTTAAHGEVLLLLRTQQTACRGYALEHGVDLPEASEWVWPF